MKKIVMLLLTTVFLSGCAGVATVGAIVYYKSQNHEVASVDIQAPADKVYQVAIDTVSNNPAVSIVQQDDTMRMLDLRQSENSRSLKVAAVSATLSKLTITSDITETDGANPLSGVLKICEELQVKCELSE
ncbi:DUF3568 domain-containing protein [Vibrio sp. 10N.286.49.C2]|uniref:DUF3568 domain-containing protein n=1 Tax=unclassified Vibrio TaxID=2614977 RepID=UPI000C844F5D|nr:MULTISPECIES: DUF3568 domain-containing protein [unclassified Vibrio]PMH39300.1 DUF3568 domain-containing protein [Vibrio sp. 10N.286.49.C2]PMH54352.1 DUF3568 domain-containing protein [Vibrio sp. 10N.286.49.B1]PMH78477.1 DUF3568 domain-containing protein [Vibrio sp. 10N.286.48.B7]